MRRTAVIDLGSNSFRLVVYGHEPGGPWMLTDEIREPVRIGAGMAESGRLEEAAVQRAVQVAGVFSSFCASTGVDDVVAVGTSAIREAANRAALLDRLATEAGLRVRVLSGPEEAYYGYLAIANSTTLVDGAGLDVGGGSIQLMCLAERKLADASSLPLGAVRVSEAFLPAEPLTAKQLKALRRHARAELGRLEWLAGCGGGRIAAIGGSCRNLATAAMRASGLENGTIQGFELTGKALAALVERLAALPAGKRGEVPGIKPDRADVILGAAVVIEEVLAAGGFEALEVTEAGLREGLFFASLLADRDPPLVDDVRRESVTNLAARYQSHPAHHEHVTALSVKLFDELAAAGLHRFDQPERELLWAAAMLHDVGAAIDYDDHHKHSQYLILTSGLAGYSPRETTMIALAARYHRKGKPDVARLGPLARKRDAERVALLAGIVRMAEQLERARDQSVRAIAVTGANGEVQIGAETRGDATLALWSAQRASDLLASAIGRPVSLHDLGAPADTAEPAPIERAARVPVSPEAG